MEGRKEIAADAVTCLVYQVLRELELSDHKTRRAEEKISRFSDKIRTDPTLGEAERDRARGQYPPTDFTERQAVPPSLQTGRKGLCGPLAETGGNPIK